MKLYQTLFCVICVTILSMSIAFGSAVDSVQVTLMDELTKISSAYTKVETQVDGKNISTDVSGFIMNQNGTDVVYVPISTIYRSIGAKVDWNDAEKRLTVVAGNDTIFIDIGKSYVTINGQQKEIEGLSPVYLMTYAGTPRTMAPLSIFKHLKLTAVYNADLKSAQITTVMPSDPATATVPSGTTVPAIPAVTPVQKPQNMVTGITYNNTGVYQEIRIQSNVESSNKNYMIDATPYGGKSRVVIEFANTVLSSGAVAFLPGDGIQVNKIDLVTRTSPSLKVRAEIELTSPRGFYSYYDKTTKEQVVIIMNTLRDIQYEKSGQEEVLQIITLAKPNYVVRKMPGKLVLDLLDTKLNINGKAVGEKAIPKSVLVKVAYSQYTNLSEYAATQQVTRVVLNFSNTSQQDRVFVKETAEGLKVYLLGDPDKGVHYTKLSAGTAQLSVPLKNAVKVSKSLNNETNELYLTIPKDGAALEKLVRSYKDGLVESMDLSLTDDLKAYKLKVKFTPGTLIYDNSNENGISVAFINESAASAKKIRIVLDPGHGGSDPGAIGKSTLVKEKELALKAANYTKTELEKYGYEVILTRSNDTKVELMQRTDFANEIYADLFVSIHYNASTSATPKGLEIYYYPDAEGKRKALAQSIFSTLIYKTGAVARGVKETTGLVVTRESAMTSVLIEMGFLSNPSEEKLIQKPDYMMVQSKAIAEGIKNYLQTR